MILAFKNILCAERCVKREDETSLSSFRYCIYQTLNVLRRKCHSEQGGRIPEFYFWIFSVSIPYIESKPTMIMLCARQA